MKRAHTLALLFIASAAAAQAAGVFTYTTANLGFPVPQPMASLTPIAGFRDYDSLVARQAALALAYDHVSVERTGTSLLGEPIYSYRFSSAGATTPEGITKGAVAMQGTIHAREWAAHEALMGVFEWLAQEADTDPVAQYINENMEVLIHPINNPDGLLQTQRYYNKTVQSFTSSFPSAGGDRDGRNRRKNMRSTDTDINTLSDYLNGVDLNRNHQYGWSLQGGTSITYGGASPGSEPESQALYAATALINTSRLRMFVDMHSFIPALYVSRFGNASLDAAGMQNYTLMRNAIQSVNGVVFSRLDVDIDATGTGDSPIGASDEYFASKYRCMSYTCEVRPAETASSGNDFVLPESEVTADRAEVLSGMRAGLYYAGGPAALIGVTIYHDDGGTSFTAPIFQETRAYSAGTRALNTTANRGLAAGESYLIVLHYNKPLREVDDVGLGAFLPGVTGSTPAVSIDGVGSATLQSWSTAAAPAATAPLRYVGDTVVYRITVPAATTGTHALRVTMTDMANVACDADPRTVSDWSGVSGWTNAEAGADTLSQVSFDVQTDAGDVWVIQ